MSRIANLESMIARLGRDQASAFAEQVEDRHSIDRLRRRIERIERRLELDDEA